MVCRGRWRRKRGYGINRSSGLASACGTHLGLQRGKAPYILEPFRRWLCTIFVVTSTSDSAVFSILLFSQVPCDQRFVIHFDSSLCWDPCVTRPTKGPRVRARNPMIHWTKSVCDSFDSLLGRETMFPYDLRFVFVFCFCSFVIPTSRVHNASHKSFVIQKAFSFV